MLHHGHWYMRSMGCFASSSSVNKLAQLGQRTRGGHADGAQLVPAVEDLASANPPAISERLAAEVGKHGITVNVVGSALVV